MSRETTIRTLDELVEALDRRVPRPGADGEAGIADESSRLRASALKRLAELQDSDGPEATRGPQDSEVTV